MNVLDTLSIGRQITRGPISLFPLYTHAPRPGTPLYAPGPVAAREGTVRVDETGDGEVPTIEIFNTGTTPVLLIEGETFDGGLQNRVLNVSALLDVGATTVPVSCVEAGRWSPGGEMRLSDRRAPRRLRRVTNRSVRNSLRADGSRHSDQGAVWHAVDASLARRGIASETSALHSAFDDIDDAMGSDFDPIVAAIGELSDIGSLPGQTGVVVAAGGRCLAADLFDAPETLAAYWRQLVTSHAFDLPLNGGEVPSVSRALRFVRRVLHAQITRGPGVGLGTEHHFENNRITGNALQCDETLVHLSVLAA